MPENHSAVFFRNAVDFQVCRHQLNEKWKRLSKGRLETFANLDHIGAGGSLNFSMRQRNSQGGPVDSIEQLYETAQTARIVFGLWRQLDSTSLSLAKMKNVGRAMEKAKNDYNVRDPGHGERWLFDIVRGMLICESEDDVLDVLNCLCDQSFQGRYGFDVVRLKNRFAKPTSSGFRDINLTLRIYLGPAPGDVFHMCELQIHCREIKELADELHSHKVYEYFRTFFRGSEDTVKNRLDLVSALLTGQFCLGVGNDSEEHEKFTISLDHLVSAVCDGGEVDRLENMVELLGLMCEREHELKVRKKLLESTIRDHGENHPQVHQCRIDLINLYLKVKNFDATKKICGDIIKSYACPATVDAGASKVGLTDTPRESTLVHNCGCKCHLKRSRRYYEDVFSFFSCMGKLYTAMECYPAARAMYVMALEGRKNLLGGKHRDTLAVLNNLGNLHFKMKNYDDAMKSLTMALEGYDDIRGVESHVLMPVEKLKILNGLGNVLSETAMHVTKTKGKAAAIEDCTMARHRYEECLLGRERLLGPAHEDTLSTSRNLGQLLHDMYLLHDSLGHEGDAEACYQASKEMFERALKGREKIFGPDHEDVIDVVFNLGTLFHEKERNYPLALKAYQRTLAGREKLRGRAHKSTLSVAECLSRLEVDMEACAVDAASAGSSLSLPVLSQEQEQRQQQQQQQQTANGAAGGAATRESTRSVKVGSTADIKFSSQARQSPTGLRRLPSWPSVGFDKWGTCQQELVVQQQPHCIAHRRRGSFS